MAGSPPKGYGAVMEIRALDQRFVPTGVGAGDIGARGPHLLLRGIVKELVHPITDLLALIAYAWQ